MGGFSPVFPVPGGSGAIYSSRLSYQTIALSANLAMSWPAESSQVGNFVADTMDVTPTANGFSLTMPTALASSTGIATIVTNQSGTYSFSVLNNLGATILTVAPGTAWLLYLTDNSTQAGTWKSFQFGANAGSINLAAITGLGIEVLSGALVTTLAVTNTGGSSAYTVVAGQRASVILWAGGAGTITLPNPATVGSNWWAVVTNAGSGNAVTSGASGNIDGLASKTFAPGNSCIVFTDGANYYTVGFQAASSGSTFSNTTIATTGGTTTLAGAQLNQITYTVTGALTSNATIVVPVTTQQYWINNQTTGAFTLTVQSATPGTTQVVAQGSQVVMYCDPSGNMVLGTSTASVSYPISIMNGGTGQITAGAALTALGGTTTGTGLFTAASTSAALTALGGGTTGIAVLQSGTTVAAQAALMGSSVPAVGTYLPAANTLGFATASTQWGTLNGSGNWVLNNPSSGSNLTINGVANSYATQINGASTSGQSYGLLIEAGTTNADAALYITNYGNSLALMEVAGDGSVIIGTGITTKGAGTLNVQNGIYLGGVNQFQSGSFTGTLTGCTTSPTNTCYYAISGKVCTLYLGNVVGTSNANTCGLTGLPSACFPSRSNIGIAAPDSVFQNNGSFVTVATGSAVTVVITSGGAITFALNGNPSSWSSSASNKGINSSYGVSVTYLLN